MQPDIQDLIKRIEKLEQDNFVLLNMYKEYASQRYPGKVIYPGAHAFDTASLIGFYGKDPIKQQTATDIATVLTALKAYGLLAP